MSKIDHVTSIISQMVKSIVQNPDAVELHTEDVETSQGVVTHINVKVEQPDIRITIGTKGATALAIQQIASLAARKVKLDYPVFIRVDAPPLPRDHFYGR